jgi:hypothetical protein
MGDRCYFKVWVRNVDAQSEKGSSILARHGLECEDTEGPLSGWVDAQMNWGGSDFLDAWQEAGFPCDGHQEGGCDYDSSSFFTREGGLFEVCTAKSGGFVIYFDRDTGEPSEHELETVREFLLGAKKNDEEMKRGPLEELAGCADTTNKDET